ncbi:EAL domain-containing protein [Neptuniibacter sp. QD29_5]|uniref:bifunctional diguanylate cyclase/phosphodiesterase n=1 Tax=Neptuniibacter sp. QD29_5 TaxID=3398207 RepID=UPI0039F54B1B
MSDVLLNIIDDSNEPVVEDDRQPWKIAIIDDEESVHQVTTLALSRTDVLGHPLSFVHAYSGEEGYKLIEEHDDIAVVLLDVVMETPDAGLLLAEQIREELNRHNVQIILRTGQPGYAPENEIIERYEINAYKTKNELTKSRLFTALATALRSYKHLCALENSKLGLRSIIDASSDLIKERSVNDFARGVLLQISALFNIDADGIFCVSQRPHNGPLALRKGLDDEYFVVAASNKYDHFFGRKIEQLDTDGLSHLVKNVLDSKQHSIGELYTGLYLSTPSMWEGVIMLEGARDLQNVDEELLQVFCMNVGLGLENAKFFSHLNKAAYFDSVTGLYSRLGLIENAVTFVRSKGSRCTIFLADLDYFHNIIESLGYDYGNKVLAEMAGSLKRIYGENTLLARLHTDVFAILMVDTDLDACDVARECAKPLFVEGNSIRLGITVGSSSELAEGFSQDTAEQMLRHAEVALKVAKENRRGAGQEFDRAYEEISRNHLNLLNDIRNALVNREFFLVLQPKVDAVAEQVNGYEALIRWQHPVKGIVPPNAFIPVIEQSGLFFDIDLYVFEQSCSILKQYPQINVPISINVSANSLHHSEFISEIARLTKELKPDLSLLQLEITENALIRSDAAIEHLNSLKSIGFSICLDDFGAGFSSLSYLLRLPLDVIKIDRSFVQCVADQKDARVVLQGMVEIGRKLRKELVVEGVETKEQVDLIRAMRVSTFQGFYFYKPLSIDEAVAALSSKG